MASTADVLRALAAGDRLDELGPRNRRPTPPFLVGYRQLEMMALAAVSWPAEGAVSRFLGDIDDWCAVGWPKWWPRPPRPGPGDPEPYDESSEYLGAALAAAQLAGAYPEGEEHEMFDQAATMLAVRAVG